MRNNWKLRSHASLIILLPLLPVRGDVLSGRLCLQAVNSELHLLFPNQVPVVPPRLQWYVQMYVGSASNVRFRLCNNFFDTFFTIVWFGMPKNLGTVAPAVCIVSFSGSYLWVPILCNEVPARWQHYIVHSRRYCDQFSNHYKVVSLAYRKDKKRALICVIREDYSHLGLCVALSCRSVLIVKLKTSASQRPSLSCFYKWVRFLTVYQTLDCQQH